MSPSPRARTARWASSSSCGVSRRGVPRRHRAERRHALHDRLARCRQGAVGAEPARHEGPLLPVADARRLDQRVPGARQADDRHRAQTYAITGPGWKGTLPAGVKEYKSPTSIVWILGRIYCTGTPEDYAAVHGSRTSSSSCRSAPTASPTRRRRARSIPSIDMKTAVRDQVNRMDAVAYFTLLAS